MDDAMVDVFNHSLQKQTTYYYGTSEIIFSNSSKG